MPLPRSRRETLLESALRLFRRRGFHATGIDSILAEAGVAKMTLYHHFRSKEDLILAALRRQDEQLRSRLARRVERAESEPGERVLALFDALGELCESGELAGCPFITAAAEFPDAECAIHRAAAEHKRLLHDYVLRLVAATGTTDATRVTRQLCLLMDGVIVDAQVTGRSCGAGEARAAARLLLGA